MFKLKAFWDLFRAGQAVANPALWLTGQVTAAAFAGFAAASLAVAHVLGYGANIDEQLVVSISGGLYAVINGVLTVISSDKIGLAPVIDKSMPDNEIRPRQNMLSERDIAILRENAPPVGWAPAQNPVVDSTGTGAGMPLDSRAPITPRLVADKQAAGVDYGRDVG